MFVFPFSALEPLLAKINGPERKRVKIFHSLLIE